MENEKNYQHQNEKKRKIINGKPVRPAPATPNKDPMMATPAAEPSTVAPAPPIITPAPAAISGAAKPPVSPGKTDTRQDYHNHLSC